MPEYGLYVGYLGLLLSARFARIIAHQYNPYSDHFLALCGHILLQIQCFCLISRNKASHARRCVVRRRFEMRWKVLTLAHPTVG